MRSQQALPGDWVPRRQASPPAAPPTSPVSSAFLPRAGVGWVLSLNTEKAPSSALSPPLPPALPQSVTRFPIPSLRLLSSPPPFYRPETRSPRAAWDQAQSQPPHHRLSDRAGPLWGQGLHLSGNLSHGHLQHLTHFWSLPKSSPGPCLSARTVPKATVRVLCGFGPHSGPGTVKR